MPSVFDTSRCSLSSIPSIGDFTFIENCEIDDAPPPIYDCPSLDFDLPVVVPMGPAGPAGAQGLDAPCTVVSLAVESATIAYNRGVSEPRIDFQFLPVSLDPSISSQVCENNFTARLDLSLPCPDFDFDTSLVTLPYTDSSATLELETKNKFPETEQCGEVITFKFGLPHTAVWRSGIGPPPLGLGSNGDYYLNLGDGSPLEIGNGDIYRKINNSWGSPITNIKGDDGASGMMPCCPATNYTSIVTGVYCQGNQLMVQYQS